MASAARSFPPSSILNPPALVLVETIASRQLIACACDAALAHGVRPGMTLAQARALCPGLTHAPHDPEEDRRALYREIADFIVLIDRQQPFGNERLLPRGTLREPPSHLSRAKWIFITKSDGNTMELREP